MPTKKVKQKMIKHRLCIISRFVACASFLILTIIGVSSLVRAMSLETIANESGIPASWKAASLGNPESITVPMTYWDQRQDDCNAANRQFEWTMCRIYAQSAQQGIVQNTLGSDGLPVPVHTTTASARAAGIHQTSENVTGHNPVQPSDNFYQWFHETARSKRVNRTVTFRRTGNNTYTYGGSNIFPLDNIDFSKNDSATSTGHNFHFTAHMRFAAKIAADGIERFDFSGDDDVWVFLNNQLVLDIGGLHAALRGWFKINPDGTLTTYVDTVGQKTINIGLKPGDVVNLDFFYAERSTTESNTLITISGMNWPISADSDLKAKVLGTIAGSTSHLVQFQTSIKNRDPEHPLELQRLASYINESAQSGRDGAIETKNGYIPLDSTTLYYTTTPNDDDSWQPVELTAPSNSTSGFNLVTPITMQPAGQANDTLYFRFLAETSEYSGTMTNTVSFYTTMNGEAGVTYDSDTVSYTSTKQPLRGAYDVDIKYIYDADESEAAAPYHQSHKAEQPFVIPSPVIEGYTPNIETVTGTVTDSDLTYIVRYKANQPEEPDVPDPEPATFELKIHYIHEDGSEAAPDHVESLHEGDTYEITSPTIEGYTPDHATISGTVQQDDTEYIVRYTKDKVEEPVIPVGPTEPTEPEKPDQPTPPTPPSSDIIFDDLTYLGPLGEIAFIPNTGFISDTIAAVFEETFAEIILSQGFIMAILLIFASSFATFFSLRQYQNLAMATRTAPSRSAKKTMPKALRGQKPSAKVSKNRKKK